jgi:hypothetical protein
VVNVRVRFSAKLRARCPMTGHSGQSDSLYKHATCTTSAGEPVGTGARTPRAWGVDQLQCCGAAVEYLAA